MATSDHFQREATSSLRQQIDCLQPKRNYLQPLRACSLRQPPASEKLQPQTTSTCLHDRAPNHHHHRHLNPRRAWVPPHSGCALAPRRLCPGRITIDDRQLFIQLMSFHLVCRHGLIEANQRIKEFTSAVDQLTATTVMILLPSLSAGGWAAAAAAAVAAPVTAPVPVVVTRRWLQQRRRRRRRERQSPPGHLHMA